jgi:predicted PurR-regulated permease PerM
MPAIKLISIFLFIALIIGIFIYLKLREINQNLTDSQNARNEQFAKLQAEALKIRLELYEMNIQVKHSTDGVWLINKELPNIEKRITNHINNDLTK